MRILISIFCIALAYILAPEAQAKWVQVESDNFHLVGEIKEKNAKKLIQDLELYRAATLQFLGKPPKLEPIKVKILIVKTNDQMTEIIGHANNSGIYKTFFDGPLFVMLGEEARHYAMHEYGHHITYTHTKSIYPLWYDEGYVEYLATFEKDGDSLSIGRNIKGYKDILSSKYWMSYRIIFNSIQKYPFKLSKIDPKIGSVDQHTFYAQAWLAVHFIQNNPDYLDMFNQYNGLINSGVDAMQAFETAFGTTPDAFEQILRKYFKAKNFKKRQISSINPDTSYPMQVKLIERKDFLAEKIYFRIRMIPLKKDLGGTEKMFAELEALTGDNNLLNTLKAQWYMIDEKFDDASASIDKALSQQTLSNTQTNFFKGAILVDQALKTNGSISLPNQKLAQSYLQKVLNDNPNHPGAHFFYALSHGGSYQPPSPQVVASTIFSVNYFRSPDFVTSGLNLALNLIQAEEYDLAEEVINFAQVWGKDVDEKRHMRYVKKFLERQKSITPP